MESSRSRLLPALAALLVLVGCGGDPGAEAPRTEPAPAQAEQSAAESADPAATGTPAEAALAVALRAADLPPGWTVQANPVPNGDLSRNPSLQGLCGVTFSSESHRTAKFPSVGLNPAGDPAVVSEAIAYDSATAGALALTELRDAFRSCPAQDRSFLPPPAIDGLAENVVVVRYQLAGGITQDVVAQGRGAVVSVLIAEDPAAGAMAARSIATRMAALPAPAIGL
ncbi:hypothetical protein [Geodermatophilus ruber]|uniref:PknH-like extracellular domain-containing protein n=1 Tax=Geodermatophilus ruber TaxID=504800 RepID=A0A1I4LT79_9ACTN|nr:hypothetical protein [Geodermatophilus ruber]SFL94204.1 hypothetical protein SAMN04488085_12415 [Geodermatophilus ruber]